MTHPMNYPCPCCKTVYFKEQECDWCEGVRTEPIEGDSASRSGDAGAPDKLRHYTAKLKTRREMERTIQRGLLGWWYDVCPGQTLELRDATAADLARCNLREGSSMQPADYLCETFDRGSLVLREAVAVLTPFDNTEALAASLVRFACMTKEQARAAAKTLTADHPSGAPVFPASQVPNEQERMSP